ncbi:hypothetical protein THIBAULT_122 [Mycobacterium phage Thibault]|uniref:Uncharacterized protein n=1 Tax=Mycobacterium phage Thibault TaxID=1052673 RepID=G1FGI7_9CAUD|nr:hypothetical protein CL87_gp122 [Mycobacterium phage Thibault]AEJ94045.1 hypothetical protein THIBAULT_122 [Mycobacterium phage Thibault]
MKFRFRQWWLGLPWPLWTLGACKPFSPWCFIEEILSAAFPLTFGWCDPEKGLWHETFMSEWIHEKHNAAIEKYYDKRDRARR